MISKGNNHVTHLLFFSQVFEANEGRIIFPLNVSVSEVKPEPKPCPAAQGGSAGDLRLRLILYIVGICKQV